MILKLELIAKNKMTTFGAVMSLELRHIFSTINWS